LFSQEIGYFDVYELETCRKTLTADSRFEVRFWTAPPARVSTPSFYVVFFRKNKHTNPFDFILAAETALWAQRLVLTEMTIFCTLFRKI
jgi:hypothetical protein